MICICIKCNRLFEEPAKFKYLSSIPSICQDCVISAIDAYFDQRTKILGAPIGPVLAEEILKDAA